MRFIVLAFSVAIAVLGAVVIVVPTALLAVSRPFLTPAGLYVAAAIRLVFGAALFLAAPGSRAPKTLRMFGVVVIVAGIVTPLVGVDRARAIAQWWMGQGTPLIRAWAGFALVLGVLVAYAITPRVPSFRHGDRS